MSKKYKKDDLVKIMTGKDKGKTGKIVSIDKKNLKVIVDGVNICKVHKKKTEKTEASILEISRPIDLSNIALICPEKNIYSKVGLKKVGKETKRVSKKTGSIF